MSGKLINRKTIPEVLQDIGNQKTTDKNGKNAPKQHQEWHLRKISHWRTQIPEFFVCKHKYVLFSMLNVTTQRLCTSKAPKNRLFRPKYQNLFCRKAVPALPRGCRWVMTAPPRQCRDSPVATPGGPYGKNGTSPPCFQWLSTALKQDFHLSPFFAQQCLQNKNANADITLRSCLKSFAAETSSSQQSLGKEKPNTMALPPADNGLRLR